MLFEVLSLVPALASIESLYHRETFNLLSTSSVPHHTSVTEFPSQVDVNTNRTSQKPSDTAAAAMPLPMAPDSPQLPSIAPSYPAITKQAASTIDGIDTDVTSIVFSDKIMITITQNGRLAQWV